MNNQNMVTSAEERLEWMSVRNLFRARVKSLSVLGTSDHISVIRANQLITGMVFIMLVKFCDGTLFSSSSRIVVSLTYPWFNFSSAPWESICSSCHNFPFLFRLPCTWLCMNSSVDVSRKTEVAYSTSASGPYSQF